MVARVVRVQEMALRSMAPELGKPPELDELTAYLRAGGVQVERRPGAAFTYDLHGDRVNALLFDYFRRQQRRQWTWQQPGQRHFSELPGPRFDFSFEVYRHHELSPPERWAPPKESGWDVLYYSAHGAAGEPVKDAVLVYMRDPTASADVDEPEQAVRPGKLSRTMRLGLEAIWSVGLYTDTESGDQWEVPVAVPSRGRFWVADKPPPTKAGKIAPYLSMPIKTWEGLLARGLVTVTQKAIPGLPNPRRHGLSGGTPERVVLTQAGLRALGVSQGERRYSATRAS